MVDVTQWWWCRQGQYFIGGWKGMDVNFVTNIYIIATTFGILTYYGPRWGNLYIISFASFASFVSLGNYTHIDTLQYSISFGAKFRRLAYSTLSILLASTSTFRSFLVLYICFVSRYLKIYDMLVEYLWLIWNYKYREKQVYIYIYICSLRDRTLINLNCVLKSGIH